MTTNNILFHEFSSAYLWAILDTETDDDGEPLSDAFDADDFSPEAQKQMEADCILFLQLAGDMIRDEELPGDRRTIYEQAGYDFWMSRVGHGVGFWEQSDWPKSGKELDKIAKSFKSTDVYIGDDEQLYFS